MRNGLLLLSFLLLLPSFAAADMPRPKKALQELVFPPGGGGARAACSVVYYDLCSGWLWTWSGFGEGDMVGVVFDLPEECGIAPGSGAMTDGFWWYWRYTSPGRGWTVFYSVYEVDASDCPVGGAVWESGQIDPTEWWNRIELGAGHLPVPDRIAITASWGRGVLPRCGSDISYKNQLAGCAPMHTETHSFFFNLSGTMYCPPLPFEDGMSPTELLMEASFDAVTATENTSWGAIKTLFK